MIAWLKCFWREHTRYRVVARPDGVYEVWKRVPAGHLKRISFHQTAKEARAARHNHALGITPTIK